MSDDQPVLVVVGASAGGVEALRALVGSLPDDFGAAMVIVLHMPAAAPSMLHDILGRATDFPVERAAQGAHVQCGHVYVCPPDHHITLRGAALWLDRGPRINGHRPAIDPLFRSAAEAFGSRAIGVLLSGTLDDGVAGLQRLCQVGATTLVQDPEEAAYPSLPANAIAQGAATKVLEVREIGALLGELTKGEDPDLGEVAAMFDPTGETTDAQVSPFTCPNCHGTLWEVDDATGPLFRCRTGHLFSADSLIETTTESLDDALWGAYRALLEQADLCRRIARRMDRPGGATTKARYEAMAADSERRAWVLHDSLIARDDSAVTGDEVGVTAPVGREHD